MFGQGRALAEQVGNERALADVLHLQTIHHMGHAEFAEGVQVGLRAAEVFEREGALWDLCGVQAFVVYEDGTVGSREQAAPSCRQDAGYRRTARSPRRDVYRPLLPGSGGRDGRRSDAGRRGGSADPRHR